MYKFYVLRPEDLQKEEILNAARNNQVVLMVEENDSDDQKLIGQACQMIRPCGAKIAPGGYSMRNVRECVNLIFHYSPELFRKSMLSEMKREKFVCMMIGSMLEGGLFADSPEQLAKLLPVSKRRSSARRYIAEGRKKSEWIALFSTQPELSQTIHNYFAPSNTKIDY